MSERLVIISYGEKLHLNQALLCIKTPREENISLMVVKADKIHKFFTSDFKVIFEVSQLYFCARYFTTA